MSQILFDREKYLRILELQGASAALTTLQKDTIQWEIESFEGAKGYQPEMWNSLHQVRQFSRELWNICLGIEAK